MWFSGHLLFFEVHLAWTLCGLVLLARQVLVDDHTVQLLRVQVGSSHNTAHDVVLALPVTRTQVLDNHEDDDEEGEQGQDTHEQVEHHGLEGESRDGLMSAVLDVIEHVHLFSVSDDYVQ